MSFKKQYQRKAIPTPRVSERGNRYMVDVTWQGERPRPTFDTKQDAEVWAAEQVVRMTRGEALQTPASHVARSPNAGMATVSEMLDHARTRVWAVSGPDGGPLKSMKQIDITIGQLKQALGPRTRLSKLTVTYIETALARLEEQRGNTARTTNRRVSALLVALKEAERVGAIDKVPRLKKAPEVVTGRVFRITPQLEHDMLTWALAHRGHDFYDFLVLSLYLGQRENETLRLRLAEDYTHPRDGYVDGEDFAVFPASNHRNKSTVTHAVPLRPIVQEVVARRRAAPSSPSARLLAELTPDMVTHWFASMKAEFVNSNHPELLAQKRDGLPVGKDFCIHIMRSEFCSRLGDDGYDVFEIMRFSGHSDPKTCQRYVKPNRVAHRNRLKHLGQAPATLPGGETPEFAPGFRPTSASLVSVPWRPAEDQDAHAAAVRAVRALAAAGMTDILHDLIRAAEKAAA